MADLPASKCHGRRVEELRRLRLAEVGNLRRTIVAQLEELATSRATRVELERAAASSINIMWHYHRRARAAQEPFGVKLNDPWEEMPEQYAMVFRKMTETLEKMPVSLKEKSRAEARFVATAVAEYIFACFVSLDPNFRLEQLEEGI
ncbi:hypothetical protein E2562_021324 [Oryza meyeriana var. granulata]|uniref:Uncharacterized protein n=1 Tax=Oryza meyeriana var. granulata TaxID=110450 RepID=A0A6G1BYS9_9ORYZ|nr:hypothetical protein E2562_021324 [Oryza meyeriana var. granulata]